MKTIDHIFIDSKAHYSLWDTALATNKPVTPFHHLSPELLKEVLRSELQVREHPLILSDSMFPVSGEIAALP